MEKFINALEELVTASIELSIAYEHINDEKVQTQIDETYPLHKDFNEIVSELNDWKKKLKEVK